MQVIDLFVPAKNDEMLFRFFRSLSLCPFSLKKKMIEIKLEELKLELRKTDMEIDNIVSEPR